MDDNCFFGLSLMVDINGFPDFLGIILKHAWSGYPTLNLAEKGKHTF